MPLTNFLFSPQLCVGFLFLILYPRSPPTSSRLPPVTHHLCHIPSFTHNFVTHHLSHPSLSHTIFHIQLSDTPSFTHHLSHTIFVTYHLSHATLSHTIFVTYHLSHTMSRTILHFAWQAWHNLTSTLVPRGRRGTISHPPSFCVAGVAQSHIHLRFTCRLSLMALNCTSIFV